MTEGTDVEPRFPFVEVQASLKDAAAASARLFELGATGIERRDPGTLDRPGALGTTLVAYFATDEEARVANAALIDAFESRFDVLVGDDWRDAWRDHFKPTRIGSRFVIRPSWEPIRPWPNEVVLSMDPGRAFGSGLHETTRLVLREVDRRTRPGHRVLDIGCGSGILGIGALLRGAASAHGNEIDEDAVPVALQNAEINGVSERFSAGSEALADLPQDFDLVLANIRTVVLVPLMQQIVSRVRPGGVLVLSGILREQREEVAKAYSGHPLLLTTFDREWVALIYRVGDRVTAAAS